VDARRHEPQGFTPTHILSRDLNLALWPQLRDVQGGFVVRPTHLTQSRFVFITVPGERKKFSEVDWQDKIRGLQRSLELSWHEARRAPGDTREAHSLTAGFLVDQLIISRGKPKEVDKLRTDEVKCMTAWGRVVAVEWNVHQFRAFLGACYFIRKGSLRQVFEHEYCTSRMAEWHETELTQTFTDLCLPKIVELAETVVVQGGYDFMRVDVLIQGYCKSLFVNELSFFPMQLLATAHLDNVHTCA